MKSSNVWKRNIHHHQVEFIPVMPSWFNIWKSVSAIHHMNRLKEKNHMIISVDAEKVLEYTYLWKKTLTKGIIEGTSSTS